MQPIHICPTCEERLTDASNAMRHHLTEMRRAFDLARSDKLTDEQQRLFTNTVLETMAEAQLAWDVYCRHLGEHGLLPSS